MTEQRARLRINLSQREFEVEGSEAFVRAYVERFDGWLGRLDDRAEPDPAPPAPRAAPAPPRRAGQSAQSFGELLHRLPRAASDVDRILAAGYFAYVRSADKSFSTGEANALLTEQGVKVGNPSQCVKQNLTAKRVFKHLGRYRVSQTGLEYLRQMLGDDLPG
ncbi:MAG: hypothetical protein K0S35_3660 [Geminicoccaceae bacterium]|nr:hypothetical protein [Geminicoccaceae bacterium]